MIKTYCDRCGSEIIEPGGLERALAKVSTYMHKVILDITGKQTFSIYYGDHPATICPKCEDAFKAWIKAGGNSQHQDRHGEPKNGRIIITAVPEPQYDPTDFKFGD
jgi:hypothetical protein